MASRDEIGQTVCDLVGNTPMVYLNKVTNGCAAKIAVKVEWMNPAGSVKDRIGIAMIEEAERQGKIKPGITTIIEPTSGNMGIGIAFVAVARGYRFIAIMPSIMSGERRTLLRAFNAELVLTDPALGVKGSVERAEQLAAAIPNSFIPMQFANKANPEIHYRTTGPEIWRQTHGKVDACVFGIGSGGTFTGVGRFLREKNPEIKLFAVEPVESPVISGGKHSVHKIQGMGTGFVPQVLDRKLYDEIVLVHSDEAIAMAKRLAREEGLLGGISSGANVVAALRVAQKPEMAGKLIVTALSSSGERYLSSALYSDIRAEMEAMSHVETLEENLKRLLKVEEDNHRKN
ncbi:hypothetical protein niasHT_010241 [Heterodera trifolii]|uniref:Cysteine synthase n=1 Tax=Heterodera trifolii TaxID=157864 RepID=A0ABD2LR07_9BILA